jgi:protein-tyrosine-phosphatase
MTRVLFVDARNTARSPMAEALFNQFAGESMRAYSCGTMSNGKVDPMAVKVMKEIGVDIRNHVPRPVTQNILAEADIVVLMGKDVHPRVFSPKAVWDFRDPTGLQLTSYRELRDAIRLNVQKLLAEIRRTKSESRESDQPIAA